MPLALKPGVKLDGLRPHMIHALADIVEAYENLKQTCTVTAGGDGKHMEGSLHGMGNALDFRRWNLQDPQGFIVTLRRKLGKDYDVILETDHIHVEYDPKTKV